MEYQQRIKLLIRKYDEYRSERERRWYKYLRYAKYTSSRLKLREEEFKYLKKVLFVVGDLKRLHRTAGYGKIIAALGYLMIPIHRRYVLPPDDYSLLKEEGVDWKFIIKICSNLIVLLDEKRKKGGL